MPLSPAPRLRKADFRRERPARVLSSQKPRVPHQVAASASAKLASRSCLAPLRARGTPAPPGQLCKAPPGFSEAPAGRPGSAQPPPPPCRRGPPPLRQPRAGAATSSRTAPGAELSARRGGRARTRTAPPGGRGKKNEERRARPAALSAVQSGGTSPWCRPG